MWKPDIEILNNFELEEKVPEGTVRTLYDVLNRAELLGKSQLESFWGNILLPTI
jgi:hypothetical protein